MCFWHRTSDGYKKIVLGSSFYHAWEIKMGMRRLNIVRTFFYFFLRWISNTKFTRHNAAVRDGNFYANIFGLFFCVLSNPVKCNELSWGKLCTNFHWNEFSETWIYYDFTSHSSCDYMQTWKFKFQMIAKFFNIISLKRKKFQQLPSST